ncbi:MAG TPA: hypothetical protein DDZ51_05475 [Planctomycetaceae bacterium]|nr:hypothetical protein [Planctomycetaceae bacterium]
MTDRREFLQTTASCLVPKSVFATSSPNFHFIDVESGNAWQVADPVQWSLQNINEPVMARAAEGLGKLTLNDGDRVIRLVVRRCSLNLLELRPGRVGVDHWGSHQADLRPFFKMNGLARPEVEVVLKDRKTDAVSRLTGDSFLYGVPLDSDFELELFQRKWERRHSTEPDDWTAAPGTRSGFAWDGVEDGQIPWAAIKSAWRRDAPPTCQNCSSDTLLVNFGLRQVGLFNRSANIVHVCRLCRRSFRDESIIDVRAWMTANLDEAALPCFELVWGKRVKRVAA